MSNNLIKKIFGQEIVEQYEKPKDLKYADMTPEQRRIEALETELKQLKRGMGATEDDWMNMEAAQMNELKFRQFKANLVAYKKLMQIVAGKLSKAKDGLTHHECVMIAEEIEPNYFLYTSDHAIEKAKRDVTKLLAKHKEPDQ